MRRSRRSRSIRRVLCATIGMALPFAATSRFPGAAIRAADRAKAGAAAAAAGSPSAAKVPLGLPPIEFPKDNAQTAQKVELGKKLYFDGRLSRDDKVACASCHDPVKGYSNGEPFATGIEGKKGGRSAPSIINAACNPYQFWDGRARSLEEQALGPIQNPIEMNMTLPEVVAKIGKIDGYKNEFQAVFGGPPTAETIAKAIASYERTLLCGNAPYDRFQAGDKSALSPGAERGMRLFSGKAHCSACHAGPTFTDNACPNVGLGMDKPKPDLGRFAISKLEGDRGSFKTPSLRDVARSAPYMHDGSKKTLEDVVGHYLKGGVANEYLDEEVYAIRLAQEDVGDLVQFLKEGLSSSDYPEHAAPKLPE